MGSRAPAQVQKNPATTNRQIAAVRITTAPTIDGDLSDAVWARAAHATGFSDVITGNPAEDQTEVYLGYDDKAIYIAFHAYDKRPSDIVARGTKRGTPFRGEDTVEFSINCFHTFKSVDRSTFVVNALGTQFARLSGGRANKLEWEGAWSSAARITTDGWTAEIKIPWSILNYPAIKPSAVCNVNFSRYQERTKIRSWWSNVGPQEFYNYDGEWTGVKFPRFHPHVSLLPFTSAAWGTAEKVSLKAGVDLRTTPTPDLTMVGTLNPDFANVEGSVEGVDFSYGERYVPDRRPFFQEGSEVYKMGGLPGDYFYSARITSFDAGLNVYGKTSTRNTIGFLSALNLNHWFDWMLRVHHDVGPTSGIDLGLINRESGSGSNHVIAIGGNIRRGEWGFDLSGASSLTDKMHGGSTGTAYLTYRTPKWYAAVTPYFIEPTFSDDLGYIPFVDYKGVSHSVRYSTEWRRRYIRKVTTGIFLDEAKHYNGKPFGRDRSVYLDLQTKNDLGVSISASRSRFEEHRDYRMGITLKSRISDPLHNYGIGASWGRQAGFPSLFLNPYITWGFGRKFTIGLSSQILKHETSRQLFVITTNYDFSPNRGLVSRMVSRNGHVNYYFAFRQSGYGGIERFIVIGDPNSEHTKFKVSFKVLFSI